MKYVETGVTARRAAAPLGERRELGELEQIIARGLGTFVEVGLALLEIRSRRLYLKAGYRSFGNYVRERWDLSETHAYRQIEAAKVVEILSPIGERLPANEAQARELVPLASDPDAVRAVWAEVATSEGKVTARTIRTRVATELGRTLDSPERADLKDREVCPCCGQSLSPSRPVQQAPPQPPRSFAP
jgi:hypothetical protein